MNLLKKSFSFLLIIVMFTACEKITDDIVNSQYVLVSVKDISAPLVFNYSQSNEDLITSVELNYSGVLDYVWFSIKTEDSGDVIAETVIMADDGNALINGDATANDNIFTGKFTMNDDIPPGNYLIEYFVVYNVNSDPDNNTKLATHNFYFDSGLANAAPVVSDLNLPASVTRDRSFTFSVKAEDPNGQADIAGVYYEIYKPDGTIQTNSQGQTQFPMFDNGDSTGAGDSAEGDGIYSFKLTFPGTVQTGTWAFHFWARDNAGNLSNLITQNIEVN